MAKIIRNEPVFEDGDMCEYKIANIDLEKNDWEVIDDDSKISSSLSEEEITEIFRSEALKKIEKVKANASKKKSKKKIRKRGRLVPKKKKSKPKTISELKQNGVKLLQFKADKNSERYKKLVGK